MGLHTTAPVSATDPASRAETLCVRWVHPWQLPDTPLTDGTKTLGRHPDNDIVLEGTTTSRHHARLLKRGSATAIEDLGRQNGVYCNGVKIERLHPLEAGTVIRLGAWVGVVVRLSGPTLGFRELAPGYFGSETLHAALELARRVAQSDLSVLLEAETGTGKELAAQAVHDASGRPGKLVPVNCAALVDSLAEAELFGHERGAFTGAHRAHAGLIREAQTGTLFLDEIADLSPGAQAKLLRALEQREVRAVGASRAQHVDFRVVSATHRPLDVLVQHGEFRADLYARLLGSVVRLPALRERREDILPLFRRFSGHPGALAKSALAPNLSVRLVEALVTHDWPMNVRQLRAIAERMAILNAGRPEWRRRHLREAAPELRLSSIPAPSSGSPELELAPSSPPQASIGLATPLPASEPARLSTSQVLAALRQSQGNVTHAARLLGVSKQTVYRLVKAEHIDVDRFRGPGRGD